VQLYDEFDLWLSSLRLVNDYFACVLVIRLIRLYLIRIIFGYACRPALVLSEA